MKWLAAIFLSVTSLFARTNEFSAANTNLTPWQYSEQIRARCLDVLRREKLSEWAHCIVDTRNAMAGTHTRAGQVWKA